MKNDNKAILDTIATLSGTLDALTRSGEKEATQGVTKKILLLVKSLQIIDKSKIKEALSLMNSMILSGEQHSERSEKLLNEAFKELV